MEGRLAAVTSFVTLYDRPKKSQGMIQFKVTSQTGSPDAPMFYSILESVFTNLLNLIKGMSGFIRPYGSNI